MPLTNYPHSYAVARRNVLEMENSLSNIRADNLVKLLTVSSLPAGRSSPIHFAFQSASCRSPIDHFAGALQDDTRLFGSHTLTFQ